MEKAVLSVCAQGTDTDRYALLLSSLSGMPTRNVAVQR